MGKVATSLSSRRELRRARAELRRLVEQNTRRKLADGDPALREKLVQVAELEAVRLKVRHGFLLRHLAPALLDAVEWLLLADKVAGREPDYASALALLLGEMRHATVGPRVQARLEVRLAELVDEVVREECK
jgi:hypothetical protein